MDKRGFTLVELLAVIVLMGVIIAIGTYGVIGVRTQIKEDLWNSKVNLIEEKAVVYGEDNKNKLSNAGTCSDGTEMHNNCLTIKVKDLIEQNYITTKEKDTDNNKAIINNTKDKNDEYYSANEMDVIIYLDKMVYAKLIQP